MAGERFNRGTIPPEISLLLLLNNRVDEKRTVPLDLATYKSEKLLAWYRTTPRYRDRIAQLESLPWPLTTDDYHKLRSRLAGAVFEDVAYYYLSSQLDEDETLLTPQETFNFFRGYYRGSTKMYPFDCQAIDGVSVPDGLVLKLNGKLPHVTMICEYTSATLYDYLEKAEQRKSPARESMRKEMPTLFRDSQTVYFLPQRSNLRPTFESRQYNVITVPLEYSDFRNTLHHMYMQAGVNMCYQTLFT